MTAALYMIKFHHSQTEGGGVLYIGNGVIAGVDVGQIVYDGQYTEANGQLSGTVGLTATVDWPLVTGQLLKAGQTIQVPFSMPQNFANGRQFQFNVLGKSVPATFTKVKDGLP